MFQATNPKVFIASESEGCSSAVMKIASLLRGKNLNTIHETSKLKYKKIFQNGSKMGAEKIIVVQLNEAQELQLKVKKMASGEQKTFSLDELNQCIEFIG